MTKRAICVGINDYSARNDCATLPDARPDGEAWAQLLPDAFGFDPRNITLIADQRGEPPGRAVGADEHVAAIRAG